MTVKDATPSNARTKALAERMFHRIQDYHKRRPFVPQDEEETDPEVKAAWGETENETKKKRLKTPKGRGFDRFLKGLEVFWTFFFWGGLGWWLGRELWRVVERLTDLPKI